MMKQHVLAARPFAYRLHDIRVANCRRSLWYSSPLLSRNHAGLRGSKELPTPGDGAGAEANVQ